MEGRLSVSAIGLICIFSFTAAIPPPVPCRNKLREYQESMNMDPPPLGLSEPFCDEQNDRFYKPKQCSGSQCYCVSKIGGLLSIVMEATDKSCICAQDRFEHGRNVETGSLETKFICGTDGSYAGPCAEELGSYHKSPPIPGKPFPVCESDGYFSPQQCQGAECFCVAKDGDNLGYNVNRGQSSDQNCQCARDKHDYEQENAGQGDINFSCKSNGNYEETCSFKLRQYQENMESDLPFLGMSEPFCDDNDDRFYKPKQCAGSQCFCVTKTGDRIGHYVNRMGSENQDCKCARDKYEYERLQNGGQDDRYFHCGFDGNYVKPCERELAEFYENLERTLPMLGMTRPNCHSDGSYLPKQCAGSECFCVRTDGTRLGYYVKRWESDGQTCECARDEDEYRQQQGEDNGGQPVRIFNCRQNGNY